MLKIADFVNFGPKYLGHQTFPDMAFNSKYSLVSHILELGIINYRLKNVRIRCLSRPNIFPLANTFAKGKMFWYQPAGGAFISN